MFKNAVVIFPVNGFHRIVVDMDGSVPRIFFYFEDTLQESGGESSKPYFIFRTHHCMPDNGVGKAEQ